MRGRKEGGVKGTGEREGYERLVRRGRKEGGGKGDR